MCARLPSDCDRRPRQIAFWPWRFGCEGEREREEVAGAGEFPLPEGGERRRNRRTVTSFDQGSRRLPLLFIIHHFLRLITLIMEISPSCAAAGER